MEFHRPSPGQQQLSEEKRTGPVFRIRDPEKDPAA